MQGKEAFTYSPPPGPPPLLSENQMLQLVQQGWLSLTLPEALAETVEDLFASSADFFKNPDGEKVASYPSKSGTEFGYYPVPEEKEYVTFRCRVHTASSSESVSTPLFQKLEDTVADVWKPCAALLFRILCDLARWSDLDPSVWNTILDGTLSMPKSEAQMTYTLLRVFQYLPTTGFAEMHTDLGLLTVCIGNRGGLEVLDRSKSAKDKPVWVCPAHEAQTATILVGETLRALSNGVFKAGMHRVVGNSEGRNSVVLALRHSSRHDIDFSLFGGEGRVSAIDWWRLVKKGKVNINTIKEGRDAQRAENEARRSSEKNGNGIIFGQG